MQWIDLAQIAGGVAFGWFLRGHITTVIQDVVSAVTRATTLHTGTPLDQAAAKVGQAVTAEVQKVS